MECPVCLNRYDLDTCIAIKLSCCHTLCKECCNNQLEKKEQVSCPQCFRLTNKDIINTICETIERLVISASKSKENQLDSKTIILKNSKIILIRNIRNQFIEIDIKNDATILQLKEMICEIERIDSNSQCLLFNGIALQNDKRISDYKINDSDMISLVVRTNGG